MKKTVKFGIFGLGRGSSFYKAVLSNNGDIVAVCDRDENKLKRLRRSWGRTLLFTATLTLFWSIPSWRRSFFATIFTNTPSLP